MDTTVKNAYKIILRNKIIDGWQFPKEILKTFESSIFELDSFMSDWDSIYKINEVLMPKVNSAINDPNSLFDSDSPVIDIVIENGNVGFYNDNGYTNISIPLNDFKLILEGWIEFLNTPPLMGAEA